MIILSSIAIISIIRSSSSSRKFESAACEEATANLCTNIMDFRGLDSSIILIVRGGTPWPPREFPGKCESSNLRVGIRPFVILRIVRPRSFESRF